MRAKKVDWLDRKRFADDYADDYSEAAGGDGVREWISVKDRLPEYKTPYDYVLVCNARENRYAIAWRDSPCEYGKIWCFQADLLNDRFVTHWMPLMETPEAEE